MSTQTISPPDPSRTSFYVTDALYRQLLDDFEGWDRDEAEIADPALRDRAARLLYREARLLDRHRYDDWLALYAPECVYWVPGTPDGGDPRSEIAVTFDDRRRIEDRIYRIRTGFAWSQAPLSRTVRQISNVELFSGKRTGTHMVRSNFMITEFWGDEIRYLAGWTAHLLENAPDPWRITAKQVNLIDCDQCIRNLSILL
jgi:3-phenylpropionate/cinnamic acid dioxygenase small subunit